MRLPLDPGTLGPVVGPQSSALLLLTTLMATAQAAPRTVELTYVLETGAEKCPDERWLRQAVSARLGYDPFEAGAPTRVDARVFGKGAGLGAVVLVTDVSGKKLGRRELSSALGDCLELVASIELTIAIAIDPRHLLAPTPSPEPKVEVAPAPAAVPVPTPPPAPAPVPIAATAAPIHLRVGAGGFAAAGISPQVTGGLLIAVALRWPSFSVGLGGRVDLPSTIPNERAVTTFVWLTDMTASFHFGAFAVGALVSAGAIHMSSDIPAVTLRGSQPLVLLGLRAEAALQLSSRLSLCPFVAVQGVATRVTVLSGTQPLWSTLPVTGQLGVRLDFQFH